MSTSDKKFKKIAAVILAAGDGKRMQSATPKVMSLLRGRPLIDYVVSAAEETKLFDQIVVVVSKKHSLVQEQLGRRAQYVVQDEQLGTGHAVAATESALKGKADHVLVLYGDMPFISSQSIEQLIEKHGEKQNVVTLMTAVVPDFFGVYKPFASFGRIVRGANGHIARVVEKKDCTEAEEKITEVNTSYFCFAADWLWAHANKLENKNTQREYYLVDLVKVAIDERKKISSIVINPKEAIGINSKEDLGIASAVEL